jgi:acyl-CoA synthetase (AMP-forming)/AMP-acid ligase II
VGPVLCATCHDDDAVTPEEILGHLKTCLASYKVPKKVVFVDEHELPHTATEKVKLADAQRIAAQRIAAEDAEWGAYLGQAHPHLVAAMVASAS